MSTAPCFPASFAKENNFRDFLFAFLDNAALSKHGLFLKERICSLKSWPLMRREAKMKIGVVSPVIHKTL